MSVDHVLRLTVRFQIGAYLREADVALPAGSTLAEVIPEIVALVGAPRISRPWLATTAAGTPLDAAVPLHQTSLDHGSVVVLTPRHEGAMPVIRDAAEALAEAPTQPTTRGLAAAGALGGTAATVLLATAHLPWSQAFGLGALAALAVLFVRREVRVLAPVILVLAALAAAAATLESARPEELTAAPSIGFAVFAAVGAGVAGLVLLIVLGGIGARTAAATAAVLGLGSIAAVGAFLPAHTSDPALAAPALAVAAGVIAVGQIPGLAVRAAGLKVPRLPTAGQDLAVADSDRQDVDSRARRARLLHEGAAIGATIVLLPALLAIGSRGGAFAQALCVAAAGAVLLHAVRHRQAVAAWAWLLTGLAATVAAGWAAAEPGQPLQWGVAGVLALTMLSAPLWAPAVPDLEPTAVVWWERAESLALAASLPLAAHLAGLFVAIRGLG